MDYSDSIDIAVAPSAAFAAVTDLCAMGRFSPENTGGEWIDGANEPALGASFKGSNTRESSTWSTVAKVTSFKAPTSFAFEVTYKVFKIARWEYSIESTPTGCRVTESWTDRRNALMRRSGDANGFTRAEFTKDSIRTTLEQLKRELEASGL
jgi:hypothetical protein